MESALREFGSAPGLRLIETMLWDGAACPRLPLHLARLARGAEALGWEVPSVLEALETVRPALPARVRLTLGRAGDVALEVSDLPAAKAQWRVGVAPARLSSGDPWLTVKSTRRGIYDASRAAMPGRLDEVVLLNERGEVCDGTITTLFFDRGQGLRTPPLSSGLLPGVLRAEIGCAEEILLAQDLPKVRIWVGNALRGLIPAAFSV